MSASAGNLNPRESGEQQYVSQNDFQNNKYNGNAHNPSVHRWQCGNIYLLGHRDCLPGCCSASAEAGLAGFKKC